MEQHLPKGTILHGIANEYTIDRALGQGSFGITYLAYTQVAGPLGAINVKVAVKEFFMKEINSRNGGSVTGGSSTSDGLFDKYRQKFRREAQNLSHMEHPGIVKVIESFDANGTSYIVMEFLGGGSLDDYITRHGILEESVALRFIRNIGDALAYMHGHHMMHLDMKPSNVMLNDQECPVLIDFGLSKHYDESGVPESSTTVGGGTPGYAPIEQASYRDGEGFPVTMDIYALGATLFKMLTGVRPPEADKIINDGFPYDDFKGVSRATVDVVAKAMAFRKADRYQTVQQMLQALPAADEENLEAKVVKIGKVEQTPAKTTAEVPAEPTAKAPGKPASEAPAKPKMETPAKPTPPAPKKKSKAWIWILVGVVVAALAVLGVVMATSGRDEKPTDDDTTDFIEVAEGDELSYVKDLTIITNDSVLNTYTYTGECIPDKHSTINTVMPHGEGKAVFSNGDTFEGTFYDGKLVNGTYTWKDDGSNFIGSFVNNLPDEGSYNTANKQK
ncbi:MAG: protein kinase [Bacteroidales bacterium]|nr:protein kinase [Bacteroidales bacterium]